MVILARVSFRVFFEIFIYIKFIFIAGIIVKIYDIITLFFKIFSCNDIDSNFKFRKLALVITF